ncbi:MAG: hypothetical protein RMK91_08345 [Pseudanabaenaceae cyanobacterium SKYGB_i_bin29]|nr:hypothetical protein [Pseudanabaenaceae cyanobacterium SKYG29]MDW8421864.1 hypothetical protein [Pseudanabaenaceae cyanobacterium SKYGB_i_bin29]
MTATITNPPLTANCTLCLTRECPLAGAANYPVRVCQTFRRANCYICNQLDCVLHGHKDSPVVQCDRFVALAA